MWRKQQYLLCVGVVVLIINIDSNMGQNVDTTKKLNIDLYFESLCPDSFNFIRNQLYRNWQDISQYVNIKFVPFGKSVSFENGTKFICQHGISECKGNRIMSCVLRRISDPNLQVKFVNCFMETYMKIRIDQNEMGQECIQQVGVDIDDVLEKCYLTGEGTQLQLEAERSTVAIQPKFVPTVVYNEVFNQDLQDSSLNDFRNVACRLIRKVYPESCKYTSVISI